jgi:Co/Zn/Cd efflux system component
VTCLAIIAKHRKGEIHMRASWIFSRNDVIANIGVITAGVLVSVLVSPLPDLIIGLIISVVVINGGISILRDVKNE